MAVAGWQKRATGHLGQVADFRLPPFATGMRRSVGPTTVGRIGPNLPFQAFTYTVEGEPLEVASLPLPFAVPPLVLHRGPTRRAGVLPELTGPSALVGLEALAEVAGTGHPDAFDIACGEPEFARAALQPRVAGLLREWGSALDPVRRDGLLPTFDLALDGQHLIGVDGPSPGDPRFPAYVTRLALLSTALVDAPIRHFQCRPPAPVLGFRGRRWSWEPSAAGLPQVSRHFLGHPAYSGPAGRAPRAESVVRGRVAGLPFTAFRCAEPEPVSALLVHTRLRVPPLWIAPADPPAPGLTGVPEFDSRFRIHCPDATFAADLLPGESLRWLARVTPLRGCPTFRAHGWEIGLRLPEHTESAIGTGLELLERLLIATAPRLALSLGVEPGIR